MADMPSSNQPPRRPSPPARSRSRERVQPNNPQANNYSQQGQFLRPPPMDEFDANNIYTPDDSSETRHSDSGSYDHERGRTGQNGFADGRQEGYARTEGGDGAQSDDDELGNRDEEEEEEEGVDYYAVLNISREVRATQDQIRTAYHTLSRCFHPDKQPLERRALATAHFNRILIAYETLNNPHKRVVYDTLGHEGLREKFWQLGVRGMNADEFRAWLEEQVRKQQVQDVNGMIKSRGDVSVKIDLTGMWYHTAREYTDENGNRRLQLIETPPVRITKYLAKHQFTIPLQGLGEYLMEPLPYVDELLGRKNVEQGKRPESIAPALTIFASLGGVPLGKKKASGSMTVLASTSLGATISHAFPPLPPNAATSLTSILAGSQLQATTTVFPNRAFITSFSRNFNGISVITKASFTSSPRIQPPTIETTLARRVGKRSQFFVQFNTGPWQWPSALDQLTRPGSGVRGGYAAIGYSALPLAPTATSDEDDEETADAQPGPRKISASKASESWSVTASAGLLVGGGTIGFQWGRTYFIATPIGSKSVTKPQRNADRGIRFAAEGMMGFIRGASWTLSASRRVFENTRLGIAVSVGGFGGKDGVTISGTWSRLGQRINVPVVIAPIPEAVAIMWAYTIPLVGYTLLELCVLRPRDRKLRKIEMKKRKRLMAKSIEKRRKAAEEAVELMRDHVERRMNQERLVGGLVILEARYGVAVGDLGRRGDWVEVTVALGALVNESQLVIPRKLQKSYIVGFYDPAPREKKQLYVRYMFRGRIHEILIGDHQGLVMPQRSHVMNIPRDL
ncbi:hypothetical protein RUND412_002129 [Rhizina undulata]